MSWWMSIYIIASVINIHNGDVGEITLLLMDLIPLSFGVEAGYSI